MGSENTTGSASSNHIARIEFESNAAKACTEFSYAGTVVAVIEIQQCVQYMQTRNLPNFTKYRVMGQSCR